MEYLAILSMFLGFTLLIADYIRRTHKTAKESPNPRRLIYLRYFLLIAGLTAFLLVFLTSFLINPQVAIVLSVISSTFLIAYFVYKVLLVMLNLNLSFFTKFKIEPFSDNIKLTQNPEIEVSAKAFSKHAYVLATTGAGKTKSVLAPIAKQFIEIGKGVMVIDPKGDNEVAKAFIELLREQERYPEDFWYFDVMKPKFSKSYNPLWSGIRYGKPDHIAVMIIATMQKVGGTATFYENIQKEFARSITKLLSILPRTGKMANFLDLYAIVSYLPNSIEYLLEKYEEELKDDKDELAKLWIKTIHEEARRNKEFRSYLRGLQQHLALCAFSFHPRLLNSYDPEIKIADGFRKGKVMYFNLRALDFPSGESLDIGKMLLMDVQSYAAYKQREGIVSEIPDMLFIDEAHNVLVPEFQRTFEMARSAGIGVVLIHQSKQQLDEIKRGMFENIFNNTNIKIILRTEDPETRKYLAEYFGQTLRYFVNVSKGGENPFRKPIDLVLPHWSEIAMQRYDYKIRPEEFLELSPGEGFIAVGDKHVLGVRAKLQYFAKELRGKLDYELIPVKLKDESWKDKDKGLCLLYEFAKDEEFKEQTKADIESTQEKVNKILEEISDKEQNKEKVSELQSEEELLAIASGLDGDPTTDLVQDLDVVK